MSKKGKKHLRKVMTTPPSKLHGKAVMRDDPREPGRKYGYATVAKTELPDYKYKKKKSKSVASKRSTNRKMY